MRHLAARLAFAFAARSAARSCCWKRCAASGARPLLAPLCSSIGSPSAARSASSMHRFAAHSAGAHSTCSMRPASVARLARTMRCLAAYSAARSATCSAVRLAARLVRPMRCLASRSLASSAFLMRRFAARFAARSAARSASSRHRFAAHSAARSMTRRETTGAHSAARSVTHLVCSMRRLGALSELAQCLA